MRRGLDDISLAPIFRVQAMLIHALLPPTPTSLLSVLDHFRLFLDAIEQAGDELPLVDYDKRSRSVPIETSAEEALAEFRRYVILPRIRRALGFRIHG